MWGSLRSSTGSAFGDSQNRAPPPTSTASTPQGEATPGGREGGGSSLFGSTTSFIRPRSSISSLLSSASAAIISSSPSEGHLLPPLTADELDNEAVTHIDSFFDRFWAEVTVFSFDRAKEIADKEKDKALKSHMHGSNCASSGFTWVILTTAMAQLAMTEKGYVNLAFLAPKGVFSRKDSNLKTILESIRHDLKKIVDSGGVTSSPARHKNSQIATCLTLFINLRLEQMEFYDRLTVFGTSKNVEITDLLSDLELLYDRFRDDLHLVSTSPTILSGISKTLQFESEILIHLLRAISSISTWSYLPSTTALQRANHLLQEWSEILLQSHSTTVKKSSFYSSPPPYSPLYLWIRRLKGALVSKYSLYFNELLSKNSNPQFDLRSHSTRLPVDHYSRLLSFQRKSDAISVSIIFDSKDTKYNPNGYSCPGREIMVPQGLESFPAILSIPGKPTVHWPNVVMIIGDRLNELNVDKLVGFFDSSMQATYFVQRIDPKMFLVVIYESRKSEKDAYTVKFMGELCMELKCGRIFSSLKTTK